MTSSMSRHHVLFAGLVGTSLGLFGVTAIVSIGVLASATSRSLTPADAYAAVGIVATVVFAILGVWLVLTFNRSLGAAGGRR